MYKPATGDDDLSKVRISRMQLQVFGQQPICMAGRVDLQVQRGNRTCILQFELVDGGKFVKLERMCGIRSAIDQG